MDPGIIVKSNLERAETLVTKIAADLGIVVDLLERLKRQTSPSVLAEKDTGTLEEIQSALPTPPATRELGTVAKLCKFNLDIDTDKVRSATFTIPEGMSGSEILAKVEAANLRPTKGDGVVWPQATILKDKKVQADLAETAGKGGRQITVTIVWDTLGERWSKQVQIMQDNGLIPTSDADLLVVAALFRDLKDYPRKPDGTEDRDKIGLTEDAGDFFKGLCVYGENGESSCARFGALGCCHDGLGGNYGDSGLAYDYVAAAGSPNSKS